MATVQDTDQPRGTSAKNTLGTGIGLLLVAVLIGLAGLILVGFGQIPGVALVLLGIGIGVWAKSRVSKADDPNAP